LTVSFGSHSVVVYSNDSYGNMGSSGIVFFNDTAHFGPIKLQYLDGTSRSSGDVISIYGPYVGYIGTSDSNGEVSCDSLPSGSYVIRAFYLGSQFGTDTGLVVPDGTTITVDYEITPPSITLLCPQNQTYNTGSVSLNYSIYDYSAISWTGYSLDGQAFTTIAGNTTLTGLPDGSHSIIVYANDTFGNMGSSALVHFTVQTIVHDIAVLNVTLSKTVVGQGFKCNITLTVANQGNLSETFNLTIYANTTAIETQAPTLANGTSSDITFTWNTTGFAYGNYTLSAYAWPVAGETNTANNNFTGSTFFVTVQGDLNGDGTVDLSDAILLSNSFLAQPGDSNWNPNADINCDGIVDISDAIILSSNFLATIS
jgi:hypothetical protein